MRSTNRYPGIEHYAVIKIRFHARMLIRQPCFACMEIEDIEQELMLDYLQRIHSFNPEKSTRNGFIAQIVEKRSFLLVRDVRRKKRRVFGSYEPWIDDDASITAITQQEGFLSWEEHAALCLDLQRAMSKLSDSLQKLCDHLKEKTVTELCNDTHCCRSGKYEAIQKIRQSFAKDGLKQYL